MIEPSFIKTVLEMGGGDLYHYGKKMVDKLLEPEKQYSPEDYQIIATLRLLYRDTFGATAELPIQLKFRHELDISLGAKIEPPADDVYRPPGLLPERYSLTLFPLGDGLLSDFCRMGIAEIMLYINLNSAVESYCEDLRH